MIVHLRSPRSRSAERRIHLLIRQHIHPSDARDLRSSDIDGGWRVKIDVSKESCVGAGQCALVAEEIFDQDDDGIVVLLDDTPVAGLQPAARRAAALCPARAISIRE
jgi:ferredoxin